MRRLLTCLAALGSLVLPARGAPQHPSDSVVTIDFGRAVLVQRGTRGELLVPGDDHPVSGSAYLNLGAGSRARVVWRGLGSLRVEGPASFEWRVPTAGLADPHDLTWRVITLGRIECEVRRPGVRLLLPGSWSSRVGRSAFRLTGGVDDTCNVDLRAGDSLSVVHDDHGRVRPKLPIHAGERVRLSAGLVERSRPDHSAGAEPWPDVSWPWAEHEHAEPVTPAPPVVIVEESTVTSLVPPAETIAPEPHSTPPEPATTTEPIDTPHPADPTADVEPPPDADTGTPATGLGVAPVLDDPAPDAATSGMEDVPATEPEAITTATPDTAADDPRETATPPTGELAGEPADEPAAALAEEAPDAGVAETMATEDVPSSIDSADAEPVDAPGEEATAAVATPGDPAPTESADPIPAPSADVPPASEGTTAPDTTPEEPASPEPAPIEPVAGTDTPPESDEAPVDEPDETTATGSSEAVIGTETPPAADPEPDTNAADTEPAIGAEDEDPAPVVDEPPVETPPNDPPEEPSEVVTPPSPDAPRVPFRSTDWRGLEYGDLRATEFGVVQRSDDVAWKRVDEDRWRVILAATAKSTAWFLGQDRDILLKAGASIVVDETGRLKGYAGRIRVVPVPKDRAAFGTITPPSK